METGKCVAISFVLAITLQAIGANLYYKTDGSDTATNDSWANAGNSVELFEDLDANVVDDDTIYIRGGTYTLTAAVDGSDRDGTAGNGITIIGVKSGTTAEPPTSADWAYGTDRPLFDDGDLAYEYRSGDYYTICNLRINSSDHYPLYAGNNNIIYNCKVVQSNDDGGNTAITTGATVTIAFCEFSGGDDKTIWFNGSGSELNYCYIHDSLGNAVGNSTALSMFGCVIDTIDANGINLSGNDGIHIQNCVFYNCGTDGDEGAIVATDAYSIIINGCIFKDNRNALYWSGGGMEPLAHNNIFHGNTYDANGVTIQGNKITTDPGFTNAASGDFTVSSTSDALDAFLVWDANIGLTGSYKWNLGTDQDDNSSSTTTTKKPTKTGGKQ